MYVSLKVTYNWTWTIKQSIDWNTFAVWTQKFQMNIKDVSVRIWAKAKIARYCAILTVFKAEKYEIQKTSTCPCRAVLLLFKLSISVSRLSWPDFCFQWLGKVETRNIDSISTATMLRRSKLSGFVSRISRTNWEQYKLLQTWSVIEILSDKKTSILYTNLWRILL